MPNKVKNHRRDNDAHIHVYTLNEIEGTISFSVSHRVRVYQRGHQCDNGDKIIVCLFCSCLDDTEKYRVVSVAALSHRFSFSLLSVFVYFFFSRECSRFIELSSLYPFLYTFKV